MLDKELTKGARCASSFSLLVLLLIKFDTGLPHNQFSQNFLMFAFSMPIQKWEERQNWTQSSHGWENSSPSPVEMSKRDLAFLYKFTLLQVLFALIYIYSTFFINKFSHRKFNSLAFFSQINLKFSKGIWFLKEARDFTRSSKNLSCALRWETRTEQYCFIYLQKDIIGQLELFS